MQVQVTVNQEFSYRNFDAWIMQVKPEGAIVVYDRSSKMTYLSNEELSQWIGVEDVDISTSVEVDPGAVQPPLNIDQARNVGDVIEQGQFLEEIPQIFEDFDLFREFDWRE